MATDPAVIAAFLARSWAPLPDFKGMDAEQAQAFIKRITGRPLAARTPPRLWQLQGTAAALYAKCCLLLYDMQLGKTKMALDTVEHLKATGMWKGTGFVIAHSPIGMETWAAQAAEHSNLTVRVCHTDPEELFAAIADGVDLIVMTWSGMQRVFCEKRLNRKKQPTLYLNKGFVAEVAKCFSLCIIDEIHKAKNPYSLWHEMAAELTRHCEFAYGLTGTLLNRDPNALWAQMFLIDRGERLGYSYAFFEACFSKWAMDYAIGRRMPTFDKTKLPILAERLATCSITYERKETGAAIAVQHGVVRLRMSDEQLEAYQNCLGEIIQAGNEQFDTEASFVRLRQISSGYLPFHDGEGTKRVLRFKKDVKFEWLEDFLKEMPADMSFIIFHEFTHSGLLLTRLLEKMKISHRWMYGGTTAAADKQSVIDFQAKRARCFVTNSASGGTSITLNAADYVLFFETPVSPITRAQAEARPNAERGERPLFVDDMVCSPTERRVLEFIAEGRDLMAELKSSGTSRKSFFTSLLDKKGIT